jgi:hypothetical protein
MVRVFLNLLLCILSASLYLDLSTFAFLNSDSNSVEEINPHNWTITVTSFQYNHHSKPSEWVERIFGSKAVYFAPKSYQEVLNDRPLSSDEILQRHERVREMFNFPTTGVWPSCSIDILAYANIDVSAPLTEASRYQAPSFGPAILRLLHLSRSITCYYRGLYENWRYHSYITKPNFWTVVIYCPIQNVSTCRKLDEYEIKTNFRPKTLRLLTFLERAKWITTFKARFVSAKDTRLQSMLYSTYDILKPPQIHKPDLKPKIGICLAIPYTSLHSDRTVANNALLIDWIRYYLKLNFAIFIYDRDAANYQAIFNNTRYRIPESLLETNLAYYNYTIRGLLDTKNRGLKYDNSELVFIENKDNVTDKNEFLARKARFEMQGMSICLLSIYWMLTCL